jgi:acetoin utilization deacetylase AcuC-like enzyme
MLVHEAHLGHPERPDRLVAIWEALGAVEDRIRREAPVAVPRGALERVHTKEHVDRILAERWRSFVIDEDTAGGPGTVDAALTAAGGALTLVEGILTGPTRRGFAIVRPPGHHAESARAMGFCFFNNIAVAAAHAVAVHGLRRVLIVDWDVHHWNGTQQIFEGRRDVLVFNVHEEGNYPGTGAVAETGMGEGGGFTVNVPLPAGSGDAEYYAVFERVLGPIAREYAPELVLVSAGFDAHRLDPLGHMRVTEAGFAAMSGVVRGIAEESAGGRLGMVLEGGYSLEALAASVPACLRVLAGEDPPAIGLDARPGAVRTIERVRATHRGAWF